MKKIRLTESDLVRIIERVIKEDDFFLNDIGKVTPTGNPSKSKYEGGKVTRATKFPDRFMDKDDREVEFNPEGKSSSIYTSLEKFGKDHPELYGKYFGNFAKYDIWYWILKWSKIHQFLLYNFKIFTFKEKTQQNVY